MEKVFIIILALGVATFIAIPFLGGKSQNKPFEEPEDEANPILGKLRRLNSERESLLAAIKEMEFDFNLGKLSKEDYHDLAAQYKAQAAGATKEIEDLERKFKIRDPLDADLEREIEAQRSRKRPKSFDTDEMEREILAARAAARLAAHCPECENPYKPDDRFCSKCGAKLNEKILSKVN